MTDAHDKTEIRDEWGAIDASFIAGVKAALQAPDHKQARQLTRDLHAADLADLIEALDQPDRVGLIAALGRSFDVEALAELDETVRDELMEALPNEVIASAIKKLDTDDALYLIEDMEEAEQQDILAKVPEEDRAALSRALYYSENTAGRLMQTEFVAVPEFWTIGTSLDHIRVEKNIPEDFVEIYVVDPAFHLKGTVPLSRLLRTARDKKITTVMDEEQTVFKVTDEQDDVAYKFEQYNLVSAAVTDEAGRLVGMLMVDDIVDVIKEEAEEDILDLRGRRRPGIDFRYRGRDHALALHLASYQPRNRGARVLGDLALRRDDPENGGAGHSDADSRLARRKRRDPDYDRGGAGTPPETLDLPTR